MSVGRPLENRMMIEHGVRTNNQTELAEKETEYKRKFP